MEQVEEQIHNTVRDWESTLSSSDEDEDEVRKETLIIHVDSFSYHVHVKYTCNFIVMQVLVPSSHSCN